MKICGPKWMFGPALFLAGALVLPAAGQGQTASYLDYDGLTRELRSLVNGSNLASMESLGTTLEGREVWMVTVGNSSGTLLWMRGQACWWWGTWKVTTWLGATSPWRPFATWWATPRTTPYRAALADHVFYFFPRLNPDGAEAMFARVKCRPGRRTPGPTTTITTAASTRTDPRT